MEDLLSVIPGVDTSEKSGYCNCDTRSNNPWYFDWEANIAKPALEQLGYSNIVFTDGERDSFGPLSRVVYATKEGKQHKFIYS